MNREVHILAHLKKRVGTQFGKQISNSTDCDKLAAVLAQKLSVNISSQTLRRFFGLIKSHSKSSHFTLDNLSKFCGFQDFKAFSRSYSNTELELFFSNKTINDHDYWEKSEQLCRQITDSPELLVSTHLRLMAFPQARKYFMEHHPLRDMIGTVYSQYFSAYLKFNTGSEAKIFAYGFLFQSAFLLQNAELMELYYNKVKDTDLHAEVHVIPAGLKFGVQLLYADFIGNEFLFRKYFAEMKRMRLHYIAASEKSVCSFEYTVLESLIFTKRTTEMKYLIENNTFQKNSDEDFIPSQRMHTHNEVWKILCAAAYEKMGDKENTAKYLDNVDPDRLEIGWAKYYSIIYYFIQLKTDNCNQQLTIISKLKTLIDETYFSYFQTLLDDHLKKFNREEKETERSGDYRRVLVS
ncbi:hypothetical protein [Kaistella palustris]|uniref:hypothetical protein n=1 Tax=Kaistella palustris TaxID=493376 RepID=UPI0004826397|nr:hypothetical protein [Kaistella palustris]